MCCPREIPEVKDSQLVDPTELPDLPYEVVAHFIFVHENVLNNHGIYAHVIQIDGVEYLFFVEH